MGIDGFDILKTLGEGAFASVHKVRCVRRGGVPDIYVFLVGLGVSIRVGKGGLCAMRCCGCGRVDGCVYSARWIDRTDGHTHQPKTKIPHTHKYETRQVTRKADGKTYALKKVDVSSLDDKELVSALNEVCVRFENIEKLEKRVCACLALNEVRAIGEIEKRATQAKQAKQAKRATQAKQARACACLVWGGAAGR